MQEQMTVNSLLSMLNTLSRAGHGDMPIFLGTSYPLLKDAVLVDLIGCTLQIRNTYYDEKMAEALRKASSDLGQIYHAYLLDCLRAGMLEED